MPSSPNPVHFLEARRRIEALTLEVQQSILEEVLWCVFGDGADIETFILDFQRTPDETDLSDLIQALRRVFDRAPAAGAEQGGDACPTD